MKIIRANIKLFITVVQKFEENYIQFCYILFRIGLDKTLIDTTYHILPIHE